MRNFHPHIVLQVTLWFVLCQYVTSDCLLPELDFPDGTYTLEKTYIDDQNQTWVEELGRLQFTCNLGYELFGAELLQCLEDKWSSEAPFCVDTKCPRPPSIENATYEVQSGVNEDIVIGSVAVYTCTDGQMLENVNASKLQCNFDRGSKTVSWVGEMPVCKDRNSCPDPGVSVNGDRSGACCEDIFEYCGESGADCKAGDTLRYTCREGYELVGNETLSCLSTGLWSSRRPKCRPLEGYCEFPPPTPLGVLKGGKTGDYFLVGDEAQLLCKPGYKCEGNEFVVCGDGGVWETEFGVCKEIFCDRPPPLQHGTITEMENTNQTIFPYDFDINYVCDEGYRIYSGDSWRSCGKRGWSGKTPRCSVIRCPDPGTPEHGSKIGNSYTVGSQVSFTCSPGYELLGSVDMYCRPNGQWTGEVARCNIPTNYCPDPGTPINGYKNMSEYKMGDKVRFDCYGSNVLQGSKVRECLNDTTWSGTVTRCVGKYDYDSKELVRDVVKIKMAEKKEEQQRYLDAWRAAVNARTLDLNFPGRIILYFAFDVSSSITRTNFDRGIAFAKALVRKVGISPFGARAGALTFSSTVEVMFLPLNYNSTEAVLDALDKIKYTGGGTAASSALHTIRTDHMPLVKQWLGDAKMKSAIFILTDGRANMGGDPTTEAGLLKAAGVEIYCIGITGDTNKNVLYDIASTSQYGQEKRPNVFMLQDYNALAWLVQEMTNATIDYSQCGLGLETAGIQSGRIVGGNVSSDPWPWMAVLNMTKGKDVNGPRSVQCGGSIIDKHLILTAAHCLFNNGRQRDKKEITVLLGLTVLTNRTYFQTRDVRKYHIHHGYRDGNENFDFDVALLELDKPIDYNAYVRPICLPPKVLPQDSPFYKPKSTAWAIGFGFTGVIRLNIIHDRPLKVSKSLKEIAFPLQPREVCVDSLKQTEKEKLFTENMFCAGTGEGKQDTCRGDSGGPVMQSHLSKDGYLSWVQVGVVSWGLGCGLKHQYGFYTHLQRLMPWIEEKITSSRTWIGQ